MLRRAILLLLLSLLLAAPAPAQINVPSQIEPHQPIVATLATDLPDGARVRGRWAVTDGQFLPGARANEVHIWAGPGTHTVTASGVYVVTRDVTIDGQTLPVLVDFGAYSHSARFTVGPEDDQPDPPVPPASLFVVILEESSERTPRQAAVMSPVAAWCERHRVGYRLADQHLRDASGSTPAWLQAYLDIVRRDGIGLPALLCALGAPDGETRAVGRPLPDDVNEAIRYLEQYRPKGRP